MGLICGAPAARSFQDNNIVLLHDEQPHGDYWPTKVCNPFSSSGVCLPQLCVILLAVSDLEIRPMRRWRWVCRTTF